MTTTSPQIQSTPIFNCLPLTEQIADALAYQTKANQ